MMEESAVLKLESAVRTLSAGVWFLAIVIGLILVFMVVNLIMVWGLLQDSAALMDLMVQPGG